MQLVGPSEHNGAIQFWSPYLMHRLLWKAIDL